MTNVDAVSNRFKVYANDQQGDQSKQCLKAVQM